MNLKSIFLGFVLCFSLSVFSTVDAIAQCPMCKISAESNLNNGGSAGKGLNKGILFLFAAPYIIIGTIGFIWYKNRKIDKQSSESTAPY